MTLPERATKYFKQERTRKLKAIEWLSVEGNGTCERHDGGELIDTTATSVETHKAHIAEIERILADAGIPFDA